MTPIDLCSHVPISVHSANGGPVVEWIDTDGVRFTEPFFEDTVRILLRRPYNQLFRPETPLSDLAAKFEQDPGIFPTGFIFHISRCGSTLISQMLSASDKNVVISEAPPIDSVIRMIGKKAAPPELLKWIINAYAPKNADRRYFIKFDSWSVIDLQMILDAFPEIPWIFVYRDPIEVLVSLLRQPGLQAVPGMIDGLILGKNQAELITMPREEYCARVLLRFFDAVLPFTDLPSGLLINYNQLPGAVFGEIASHFRLLFSAREIELMNAVTLRHAKNQQVPFSSDSMAKHAEASDMVRDASANWVLPLYLKLEALRTMDRA